MRTIQDLPLPDNWSELLPSDRRYAFHLLLLVINGEMTPFEFQLRMLLRFTGYHPSRKFNKRPLREQEAIQHNLIHLADRINFAFTVENNQIHLNYYMPSCPLPSLDGLKPYDYTTPIFDHSYTVETNLTARQYIDCCELLQGYYEEGISDEERAYYLTKLIKTLYRTRSLPATLPPEVAFGIAFWFESIMLFWQQHPIYSVLYETHSDEQITSAASGNQLSLGMSEILLELTEKGYTNAADMLLTDFFDAQVKLLKDRLLEAKASGLKPFEIAQKTGLSLSTVTRLT